MANRTSEIYVNLPVRDLERSKAFFAKLGFGYNATFTDAKAACMTLNEKAAVMLLDQAFFKTFTKRELADSTRTTEGIFAISAASRADVDEMVNAAVAAGATLAMDPVDHGFMYYRSFYDLDGHHWEVLWMNPEGPPPAG